MPGIVNFLTGDSAELFFSTGQWTVTGGGGATLSVTTTKIPRPGTSSLKIQIPGTNEDPYAFDPAIATLFYGDETQINSWRIPAEYAGWPLRASLWIYSPVQMLVVLALNVFREAESSSVQTPNTVIPPHTWTLVSVEQDHAFSVPNEQNTFAYMTLAIAGRYIDPSQPGFINDTVYVSLPAITTPLAVTNNIFAAETWARHPQYMKEADRTQTEPDFPLLRFLDISTHKADEVFATWNDIRHIPPDVGDEERSDLVDPDLAEEEWLPWLAQFMGVRLVNTADGFSSWAALIDGLDADESGAAEWDEWETEADTGDAGTDVSWEELEQFNPALTQATLEAYLRWQVATAAFGLKGGTVAAIKAAARNALTGNQTVQVIPLADGNPWLIRLVVSADEVADLNSVTAAVEKAVPAGFRVDAVFGPAHFPTVAAVASVPTVTVSIT